MNVPIPLCWRRAVALGIVALPGVASAQDRDPFAPPPRPVRTVEILYGTTKVWPPPARPAPVLAPVPPPRLIEEKVPTPAPIPPIIIQTSTTEPRPVEPREPREPLTIVLANYTTHPAAMKSELVPPTAPWLGPTPFVVPALPAPPVAEPKPALAPIVVTAPAPAAPATPPQPTVVVVRESAGESRPAPAADASHGVTLGNEAVLGLGIGVAGLGLGVGLAGRRRREPAPQATPRVITPPIPSPTGDGMMLLGRYNAGPVPTTAEKFDIGPSYQMEVQEKKKVEAKNQEAVLEFILSQNLALHAELAGPEEALPEAVEVPATV